MFDRTRMGKQQKSAGVLMCRGVISPEFFLVHPGGPFWKNKDAGAWSIPKGEFDDEEPEDAARREFGEETGFKLEQPLFSLGTCRLKSGKLIYGFGCRGDADPALLVSNRILVEWPPRTGKMIEVPEVDRGGWFTQEDAEIRINPAQAVFLRRCRDIITVR